MFGSARMNNKMSYSLHGLWGKRTKIQMISHSCQSVCAQNSSFILRTKSVKCLALFSQRETYWNRLHLITHYMCLRVYLWRSAFFSHSSLRKVSRKPKILNRMWCYSTYCCFYLHLTNVTVVFIYTRQNLLRVIPEKLISGMHTGIDTNQIILNQLMLITYTLQFTNFISASTANVAAKYTESET